jgi:excisionase family DNA binding protein
VTRIIIGPDVLNRAELAQALGVHPATVTRWAKIGVLPAFRTPSGERRYHRRDVENFLNAPGQGNRISAVPGAARADAASNCHRAVVSLNLAAGSGEDPGCCLARPAMAAGWKPPIAR